MKPPAMETSEVRTQLFACLQQGHLPCELPSISHRPVLKRACPSSRDLMQVTVLFMANVRTIFDKDWTSVWEDQQAWLTRKKEHDAAESKKAKEV